MDDLTSVDRRLFGAHLTDPATTALLLDGPAIRRWRRARGIRSAALADRLGVPLATFRRWETGARAPAHPLMLLLALRQLDHENGHRHP